MIRIGYIGTPGSSICIMKEYKRLCPGCSTELTYRNPPDFYTARKKNTLCRRCSSTKSRSTEEYKLSVSGSGNPFYGKQHTQETIEKLKNRKLTYTEEQKQQAREQLAKVANTKHPFKIWKETLSPEECLIKEKEYREKLSKAFSGKNNPMYGKTPSIGSGVGWSGWFKSTYFRSFRELTFMLTYDKWTSGEVKKYRANYIWEGKDRTCYPDFIWNNTIIEIKPLRLQNTPLNIAKKEAMQNLANELEMEYLCLDLEFPDKSVVKKLIESGDIILQKRYKDRIMRWAGCCVSGT